VVLMDLILHGAGVPSLMDGFAVLRELRNSLPSVRPIVFSAETDPQAVERCYGEGACGYLFKISSGCEAVAEALRRIANGELLFPLQLTQPAPAPGPREPEPEMLTRLTQREREILGYLSAGADNLKIAVFCHISERTVKAHVSSLYRKLEVENRTQLALRARELGIRALQGV